MNDNSICRILVELENMTIVPITILGSAKDKDVISYLKGNGMLRKDVSYAFSDWPRTRLIDRRPFLKACVCELDKDKVYHIV